MGGDAGRELSGGRLRCMLANAIGRLWQDRSGGYGIAFTVALVPIFGALAIAVDFSEMNRQRQATLNALDAAGIATARQIVTGVTDDELRAMRRISSRPISATSTPPTRRSTSICRATSPERRP